MRTKLLLAASVVLVVAGSIALAVACGSSTPLVALVVQVEGAGRVTGGGLDCQAGDVGTCSTRQDKGKPITLTATPAAEWTFVGWTTPAGSETANPLQLIPDEDTVISASFGPTSPFQYQSGIFDFTLGTPGGTCPAVLVPQLSRFVTITFAAKPSFRFQAGDQLVDFEAATWNSFRATGQGSPAPPPCPLLGTPPCQVCYTLALDVIFSSATAFAGTLTFSEQPAAACGQPHCTATASIAGTRR